MHFAARRDSEMRMRPDSLAGTTHPVVPELRDGKSGSYLNTRFLETEALFNRDQHGFEPSLKFLQRHVRDARMIAKKNLMSDHQRAAGFIPAGPRGLVNRTPAGIKPAAR